MTAERTLVEAIVREMSSGRHGHFASHLADAWYAGDSHNRARIEQAFPDLFYKVQKFIEEFA